VVGALSSHDPQIVLGLGKHEKLDWLEINGRFRAARLTQYTNLPIDCSITIVEGDNKWTQSNAEPEGISSRASGSHLTELNQSSERERGSLVDRTGFWTYARAKSLSSSRVCPLSPELHRVAVI
jgi:hypothetical protein